MEKGFGLLAWKLTKIVLIFSLIIMAQILCDITKTFLSIIETLAIYEFEVTDFGMYLKSKWQNKSDLLLCRKLLPQSSRNTLIKILGEKILCKTLTNI